jgi:ABC-type proline/glycine betaine transport system ATPase subunit
MNDVSYLHRILVLSNGCLQEYDEPTRLAADPNSEFTKLLRDANIRPSDITRVLST